MHQPTTVRVACGKCRIVSARFCGNSLFEILAAVIVCAVIVIWGWDTGWEGEGEEEGPGRQGEREQGKRQGKGEGERGGTVTGTGRGGGGIRQ